jgi:pyruvate,water dikinase
LRDPHFRPLHEKLSSEGEADRTVKARQLIGQPAGEGVAVGRARVVKRPEDLLDFKRGEILVCDAVDPNMTFVVPLAGGIIERRGGMLIHGAIIAREYGLPCVTGVPEASTLLRTGDRITVDGYLGIVTVGSASDHPALGMFSKPRSTARQKTGLAGKPDVSR